MKGSVLSQAECKRQKWNIYLRTVLPTRESLKKLRWAKNGRDIYMEKSNDFILVEMKEANEYFLDKPVHFSIVTINKKLDQKMNEKTTKSLTQEMVDFEKKVHEKVVCWCE
jgi:hypothetical protein